MTRRILAAFAILAGLSSAALAQKPASVSRTEVTERTATIVSIDHTARSITLKTEHGTHEMAVGPEVKRFDELKVGDEITFRYQESVVARISKAGGAAGSVSSKPEVSRGTGARPSATVTQTHKATVTIKAIDTAVPSVTVATADGQVSTLQVRDKQVLEGFKVGDKVELVLTEAMMIIVK